MKDWDASGINWPQAYPNQNNEGETPKKCLVSFRKATYDRQGHHKNSSRFRETKTGYMKGKTVFFPRSRSQIDQKCPLLPIRENIGAQTPRKPPNTILSGCQFGHFSVAGRNSFFEGSSQTLFWLSRAPCKRPRTGDGSPRAGQSGPGTLFSKQSAIGENVCFA